MAQAYPEMIKEEGMSDREAPSAWRVATVSAQNFEPQEKGKIIILIYFLNWESL